MSIVDSFANHFITKQPHFNQNAHLSNHTISPQEQKAQLIIKIQTLMAKNQALEEKKLSLQGTIFDLRQLMTALGNESIQQSHYLHKTNENLSEQVHSLTSALKYSHTNGKHLQRCAQFWNEFLS